MLCPAHAVVIVHATKRREPFGPWVPNRSKGSKARPAPLIVWSTRLGESDGSDFRAIHCNLDKIVPANTSQEFVGSVKSIGGRVKLTLLARSPHEISPAVVGHPDVWR